MAAASHAELGFLREGTWVLRAVVHAELELAGDVSAPAAARAEAARHFAGRVMAPQLGDLLLLVTELVTNAVRHACAPDGSDTMVVHLAAAPGRVRVEVCDSGPGFDPRPGQGGVGGGFGLVLLRQLADRWGITVSDGTCAWFELDI